MLGKILPYNIYKIIDEKVNYKELNEIRLRENQPIVVFINGQPFYLGEKGVTSNETNAISITKQEIESIVFSASDFSIYSVNEQIKKGFLIIDGGIRIGLCGNVVSENGDVKTISNFSSLNIKYLMKSKIARLMLFHK